MNSHVINLTATANISAVDQAHIWRSRLLDAFADFETNVVKLLAKSDKCLVSETAPLGQKIEALKQLQWNPSPAKNYTIKITEIAASIAPYLVIRSDIVHSKLVVSVCDNVLHAKFCNTSNGNKPYAEIRMLKCSDFDAVSKEVRRLSNQLNSILNPPPSQPQQKPAATTGP